MELTYNCPECNQEVEAYIESHEEISVYCEDCELDFTDETDVYEDYIGFMTDYYSDICGER